MGEVFYAAYTALFQPTNQTAWDDIELQFSLMHTNTKQYSATTNQTQTGLLYHGYDYSHVQDWASPDRGHSPEVWDRALGWYFMALVDVLQIAPPEQTALKKTLKSILADLAPNLVKAADPETGVWWLVMTWPGRAGNYLESSAGSMFIYALLRAVRLGYLEDLTGVYVAAAKKAFEYATTSGEWVLTNSNGTMSYNETVVVGSLQPGNDYDVSSAVASHDRSADDTLVLYFSTCRPERSQGSCTFRAGSVRDRSLEVGCRATSSKCHFIVFPFNVYLYGSKVRQHFAYGKSVRIPTKPEPPLEQVRWDDQHAT